MNVLEIQLPKNQLFARFSGRGGGLRAFLSCGANVLFLKNKFSEKRKKLKIEKRKIEILKKGKNMLVMCLICGIICH